MAEKVILGKGCHFEEIPRDSWEEKVAIESQHIPAVLDFMTMDQAVYSIPMFQSALFAFK